MRKPIYANKQHEVLLETYMSMTKDFVKDIANETKWLAYKEILDIIIEYHNNYGNNVRENNWYDWVMILPVNVSLMTNGFFAGVETKKNMSTVRAYKVLLNEMLQDIITKIEALEPVHE